MVYIMMVSSVIGTLLTVNAKTFLLVQTLQLAKIVKLSLVLNVKIIQVPVRINLVMYILLQQIVMVQKW